MSICAERVALIVAAVAAIVATMAGLAAAPPGDRTIALHNIHTKETVTVTYRRAGKLVPEAKKQIDWILRDWRRDEATDMDIALIDLIHDIHAELGSKQPVHIISGYRARATNDMLRKTAGGQASESRHILGKAVDVHFPDVPVRQLRYSALIRERGGVGYYPTSATPFVHLDTDAVRHWPRLPRQELALLFPDGRTRHQPADGGPITREDARAARGNTQLAQVVADFFSVRAIGRSAPAPTLAVASAGPTLPALKQAPQFAALSPAPTAPSPPLPTLVSAPRPAERPSRFTVPTAEDRAGLARLLALAQTPQLVSAPRPVQPRTSAREAMPHTQLAAIDPSTLPTAQAPGAQARLGDLAAGWSPAPVFDEEHPDELSYRPFPVAPLLTASASIDDPVLSGLEHPDAARALELMSEMSLVLPMRLRPGLAIAERMADPAFRGGAINAAAFATPAAGGLASRAVRTAGP